MLTAQEFDERMERVGQLVAELAAKADDPASLAAAELLRTSGELHAAGLRRMLALIHSGGNACKPLREKYMQDDIIRSMLLFHGLHPIDLQTRLSETVGNLRPLVESYGGTVSIANISRDRVTLWLDVADSSALSPVVMLKELLEHAIVVAAPDVAEILFDDRPAPSRYHQQLPIISS